MGSLCLCNGNDRGHICIYSEIKVFEVINTADDFFYIFFPGNVQDGKGSIFFCQFTFKFFQI